MRSWRDVGFSLIIFLVGLAFARTATSQDKWVDGTQQEWPLVSQIQRQSPQVPVLLEVSGRCSDTNPELIELPDLSLAVSGTSMDLPYALKKSLSKGVLSPEISVDRGLVVARWPGMPNGLLRTRIENIRLNYAENYDPVKTISAAMTSSEVLNYGKSVNARHVFQIGGLVEPPRDQGVHVPDVLGNVSVEDIFVTTLRTFGGVMTYSECRLPNAAIRYNVSYDYPIVD
ncbi:hypothetical protein [Dyella mobilis]|uniref:Uncharacterized protein n=1 Tax=Dyella mobilis TaxID=1849582 RepID=A0ABS2KC74_9GAMM|nr:hypothetical protein [Dyella mobilis]MBM7128782.1 hypothetical protein [Dyella mobilis]GLQ99114.1 hypothetical protein GCM10007863_35340 [Dyella mobilis]